MSDFDFDEIDKAVNGALSNDTPDEPRGSLASTRSDDEKTTQNSTPQSQPVSSIPAARRGSSGRFMDMVHSSSDMRRANGEVSSSPRSSVGSGFQAPTPSVPKPPVLHPEPPASIAPEPEVDVLADNDEQENDWSVPQESPFLAGAKVEKRPLGGAGVEPTADAYGSSLFSQPKDVLLEAPEEELMLEAPDEPRIEASFPDPIDFSETLKAVDTDNTENTLVLTPVEPEPVITEQVETKWDESAPVSNEPIGPTSITQQYKEQPAAVQEPGAVFDTEAYHQPIAHPVKKRSGYWVILWIFLLVVLGAGAGAAFFFYVLPML